MITLKNSQATSTDKPRSLPHVPVLLKEVISGLNIKPDGIYVDLTLGRAGHAKAILEHLPNGLLIGIDRDNEAIKEAKNILSKSKNRYLIQVYLLLNLMILSADSLIVTMRDSTCVWIKNKNSLLTMS